MTFTRLPPPDQLPPRVSVCVCVTVLQAFIRGNDAETVGEHASVPVTPGQPRTPGMVAPSLRKMISVSLELPRNKILVLD